MTPPERAPGAIDVPLLFTPGPLTTSAAVKHAMLTDLGSRDGDFVQLVARVRERLLEVAGASGSSQYTAVPMQGSGTFTVEAMLGTLVPADGRLLVLENGAYGRRMIEIVRVLGIDHVTLGMAPSVPISPDQVRAVMATDRAITHVALVHCETTTGVLNPLGEIAAVVTNAGRRLLVDAMSSFGAVPVAVADHGIDALAASSNKCLEGVPGIGFVVARVASLEAASKPRSVSLDLAAQWRAIEANGQFRFTPPTHVLLALDEALAEHAREGGVAGRAARYRRNHEQLVAGMRRLGFREVVDPAHQSDVITSFFYPNDPAFVFEDFYRALRTRNFVIYPGKLADVDCFRIGTIGRIFPEDIDLLVDAIRDYFA
jgi:2-aminoethylphosphonate-pyruvate transaminase